MDLCFDETDCEDTTDFKIKEFGSDSARTELNKKTAVFYSETVEKPSVCRKLVF